MAGIVSTNAGTHLICIFGQAICESADAQGAVAECDAAFLEADRLTIDNEADPAPVVERGELRPSVV